MDPKTILDGWVAGVTQIVLGTAVTDKLSILIFGRDPIVPLKVPL
jgi:hypothetical protein